MFNKIWNRILFLILHRNHSWHHDMKLKYMGVIPVLVGVPVLSELPLNHNIWMDNIKTNLDLFVYKVMI